MFDIIFYSVTAVLLGMCIFSFVFQVIRALYFRRKVADAHGYTEGIMTGISYPLQIIAVSALFVQFISFIILQPETEFSYCLRSGIYILTITLFFIAKSHTPKLLAYWFGKTNLCDGFGEKGKIQYSDIYCATLPKNTFADFKNPQRLCKLSFYAKTRTKHGLPVKYTCKMTALEIKALSRQVDIRPYTEAKAVKKEQLNKSRIRTVLPYIKAFCLVSFVFFIFSTGVMFAPKYSPESYDKAQIPDTITEISQVISSDSEIVVYYEKINTLSVYEPNGTHRFSLVLDEPLFAKAEMRLLNGAIYCKAGNSNLGIYSLLNGNSSELSSTSPDSADELFADPAPSDYCTDGIGVFKKTSSEEREYLFTRETFIIKSEYPWIAFILSLTMIFILKFIISDRTVPERKIKRKKHKEASTESDTETTTD